MLQLPEPRCEGTPIARQQPMQQRRAGTGQPDDDQRRRHPDVPELRPTHQCVRQPLRGHDPPHQLDAHGEPAKIGQPCGCSVGDEHVQTRIVAAGQSTELSSRPPPQLPSVEADE